MALKVDYVAKEAAINLRRNLTLTFATVITVAIALTLVGASLLMRQGVKRSNVKFHGDIQTIVYMNPDASQDQVDAVKHALDENPHLKSERYLDKPAAYQEFLEVFFNEPDIQKSLTQQEVPTSYKLQFNDASAEVVSSLQEQFSKLPGVYRVIAPTDQVKKQEDSFAKLSTFSLVFAGIVGAVSLILIVNSIRIAMFARRREIEVMKLVGATNWFIRVPFMAEGLVQGIIGAALGIGIVAAVRNWMLPTLVSGGGIWTDFHVDVSDVRGTAIVLFVGGAVVGILGSAVAATRFLDV
jgi:cell division transport system permease protein